MARFRKRWPLSVWRALFKIGSACASLALLLVCLFVALAAVMYLTRGIEWGGAPPRTEPALATEE